jgi:amidohydrolase
MRRAALSSDNMRRRDFLAVSAGSLALAADAPHDAIADAAVRLKPWLIEQRRDFHMHPELQFQEVRTGRVVAERLQKLGLSDIQTGVGKSGVTALVKGGKPGPVVALRADMDALPIDESNYKVPYQSKNPGVKHACGHDAHTTMLLGVAEVLQSMRAEMPGTVKLVFQPAEEGGGGAERMIADGALKNPVPAAILGQHVWPQTEIGKLHYAPGPFMASADTLTIRVRGKNAHGARPEEGIDAILVAAQCITALQSIRSRRIATSEPMVLTLGKIEGGTAHNIIAGEVAIKGTLRTLNSNVRDQVFTLMHQTLKGVTEGMGASYDLESSGTGLTYNDPSLVEKTLPTFQRAVGASNVVQIIPQMVAEDFSAYQKRIPGFFYFLGIRNEAKGLGIHPVHTPEFDIDEEALPIGVRVMASAAWDFLARG